MTVSNADITSVLKAVSAGDDNAWEQLISVVHAELRAIARGLKHKRELGESMQSADLVNELYIRLVESGQQNWDNRKHFFRAAAIVMSRILIDGRRRKNAIRRGGGRSPFSLKAGLDAADCLNGFCDSDRYFGALDEAMRRLGEYRQHSRKAAIVNMHFFAGLSFEEVARKLGVSTKTVGRDWEFAKAWLRREIERIEDHDGE